MKQKVTRFALTLLVMMLTTATAWAGTVDVTVNVTGSGSVSIGNQTATAGNPFTTSVDDGASVTLTFAPDAGNIVTVAKRLYKYDEHGTAEANIAISGSTATFQIPNDIWNGTGVTINVTFGDGLIGGTDEASAVALTDATVSNLAGGYYKVESDISFDHTLNLIGDTYLVIASGAKMTVSSSENGINGESYALNVLGEGTLNVTTTGSYKIAVYVSSYTQLGCSVNLTTTYFGMRCSDSFNISGGSFKTNGSKGIYPGNAVNISGGKLEASNIDANINLSYSNTDDYIKVDSYTSGKTMTIANGQTFTDGTTNYSGTITNLSPLNGKKLFPFVYIHLTLRDATCTEVGIKQECWQRSSDGKYFSDENGTSELNASDVETPMIPHTGVHHDATDTHIEYWQCSVCGKYFSNSGCTTEITEEDTKFYRTITIDNGISGLVTSNVDKAVAGTTVTLTVSHLIDTSTLQVNSGSVALADAGNGTYTFTVPAADVTVTASTATTYSVNLPANMEIVSATNTADGSGKYISGTVVTFKASFSYTASNVYDGANTLTADDSGNYSVTVGTADITVTATIEHSSNIDLSQAPSDFTVVDGDVLTGSTSHTVTIANGASITLNDATITGGIVCETSAEITLVGTNSVTGASQKAGIQVGGSNTTLTIKGNGSLTANGGSQSAGIGLSRAWDVDAMGGDIVIEGGTITATGNGMGAGIGTGLSYGNGTDNTATIGNITIKGGTVRAISGTNNDYPGNGIGKGGAYNSGHAVVGTITIYDGIDMVDASSISESIVYMHGESEVTANKTEYFTIIENGNRRVIAPKDDTDYTINIANDIEHGTLTGAATAKFGDNVTITATPALGYRFSRLVVKDAQNNEVESTRNSFFMPKSNVTVSAVFEQGVHGTTEFAWGYYEGDYFVKEATIYDGLTTVNLQQGKEYCIGKDYYEPEPGKGFCDNTFRLDEDPYAEGRDIPYSGGTGIFQYADGTKFSLGNEATAGYYDITMTDVGNGKWNVSILKTAGQMDVVPDQTYTGSAITPEPLVIAGSLNLTKGTDYVYSYTNNTDAGTAKVIATFQGDYASLGSVEKEFTILPSTVIVNVTGNGTVTYNDKVATNGEVIGVVAEKGTDVTLTFAPENGYAVSVAYGYTNNSGTTAIGLKLPISGTTATLTVPNDLKDGTYVNLTVTFVSALVGGADEASAVALTDNTVTNFAGGWYKVDSDITFDHTLNLLGDTHLIIDDGKTMTVNTATSKGILSDYTLFVSGEGTLSVTTTKAYEIAVRVGSYVQTGATVTANGYIGIRCKDNFDEFNVTNDFTFSGGQLTATGSGGDGIWADNDITLSCTNATDFIQASSYSSVFGAVKIADGKALYVDASGTLHENVIAIPLDNTMTTLAAGWYVVNSDVAYTGTVTLSGDVKLILGDGCTMSFGTEGEPLDATIMDCQNHNLTIYGQSGGTGWLKAYSEDGINSVNYYTQYSGNVVIFDGNGACIYANNSVTLLGGTLDVESGEGANGDISGGSISILGGKLWARYKGLKTMSGMIILDYTNATDQIYVKAYNPQNGLQIADGKTLVDDYGVIWSGTLDKDQIEHGINNRTLKPLVYSGVTLTKEYYNVSATFDGTSETTVSIPENVKVNSVTYNRTFTEGRPSTVMLPFSLGEGQTLTGGTLYKFSGVTKNETTGMWEATMTETATLQANTPYLLMPNNELVDGKVTFNLGSSWSTVTLNTTGGGNCLDSDTEGWVFHGTYSKKLWNEVETHDYGFAATSGTSADNQDVEAGQFVRLTKGASAKPMRCYLSYVGGPNQARALTRGAAATDEELDNRHRHA